MCNLCAKSCLNRWWDQFWVNFIWMNMLGSIDDRDCDSSRLDPRWNWGNPATALYGFASAATMNATAALLGYFGAALLIDNQNVGRLRLQVLGFFITGNANAISWWSGASATITDPFFRLTRPTIFYLWDIVWSFVQSFVSHVSPRCA